MDDKEKSLFWECAVLPEGLGSTQWIRNDKIAGILEGLIPDYNLEQMVSDREAVIVDGLGYCLTTEGFAKFITEAQQKGDPQTIKTLQDWQKQTCLRTHGEWVQIL